MMLVKEIECDDMIIIKISDSIIQSLVIVLGFPLTLVILAHLWMIQLSVRLESRQDAQFR